MRRRRNLESTGTLVRPAFPPPPAVAGRRRVAVIMSHNAHEGISVRFYRGGVTVAPSFLVLKPWMFRKSIFDGMTWDGATVTFIDRNTITMTAGTVIETFKITPIYQVGSFIEVEPLAEGWESDDTVEELGIRWQDANTNPIRSWAREISL